MFYDDIFLREKTEDYKRNLYKMLQILRNANFALKDSISEFFKMEVTYFGYNISNEKN